MFKVGNRVQCVNVKHNSANRDSVAYAHYLNKIGIVERIDGDYLEVLFPSARTAERMFAYRFRPVISTFGVDIKFDNVDDAIALATKLAQEFGRPVGVISQ